jgi:hypothetical protein
MFVCYNWPTAYLFKSQAICDLANARQNAVFHIHFLYLIDHSAVLKNIIYRISVVGRGSGKTKSGNSKMWRARSCVRFLSTWRHLSESKNTFCVISLCIWFHQGVSVL